MRAPHLTPTSQHLGPKPRPLKWIREVRGLQLVGLRCVLFAPFFHPTLPRLKKQFAVPSLLVAQPPSEGRVPIPAGSGPAGWREPAGAGQRGSGRNRAKAGYRAPRSNSRHHQLTSCAPPSPSPKAPSQ